MLLSVLLKDPSRCCLENGEQEWKDLEACCNNGRDDRD